jgi:ferredoxin-NADP reductase
VKDNRYVMIAGGVGITPIYCNCRYLQNQVNPPKVVLIYCVHHETDILFKEDLDAWFKQTPDWTLNYVVSSQPDWKGIRGRLTPQMLKTLLENDLSGTFFLCGPLGMIRMIRTFLLQHKVPQKKIRQEQFVFLP